MTGVSSGSTPGPRTSECGFGGRRDGTEGWARALARGETLVSDLGLVTSVLLSTCPLCVECVAEKASRAPRQVARLNEQIDTEIITVHISQGRCGSCQKQAALYAFYR